MLVRDILATKGSEVVTIAPTATVADLVGRLAEHGIGALVVSADGAAVEGIVSERDIARALHRHGADLLTMRVEALMTAAVQTCAPSDDVETMASLMTEGRFRHLPVVEDSTLVGIVSIGDVVKKRIEALQDETEHLLDYVSR